VIAFDEEEYKPSTPDPFSLEGRRGEDMKGDFLRMKRAKNPPLCTFCGNYPWIYKNLWYTPFSGPKWA
jgi:hypothetical protein